MSVVWDEEERLLCSLTCSLLKHRQVWAAVFVFQECLFSPRRSPLLFLIFLSPLITSEKIVKCCKIGNFFTYLLRMIFLQFNYIVFSDAEHISISILCSPSFSARQLYPPRQLEHIINLHHLRLMFTLCERAARDKPIKNKIYYSLKAVWKVITKFQRCARCLPIRTQ